MKVLLFILASVFLGSAALPAPQFWLKKKGGWWVKAWCCRVTCLIEAIKMGINSADSSQTDIIISASLQEQLRPGHYIINLSFILLSAWTNELQIYEAGVFPLQNDFEITVKLKSFIISYIYSFFLTIFLYKCIKLCRNFTVKNTRAILLWNIYNKKVKFIITYLLEIVIYRVFYCTFLP